MPSCHEQKQGKRFHRFGRAPKEKGKQEWRPNGKPGQPLKKAKVIL